MRRARLDGSARRVLDREVKPCGEANRPQRAEPIFTHPRFRIAHRSNGFARDVLLALEWIADLGETW